MATAGARHRGKAGDGRTQWVALGSAAVIILVLTFALGMLVGRQWARQTLPSVAAEPTRKPASAPRRGGLTEMGPDRTTPAPEKLTFYQTLTAPLGSVPPSERGDVKTGAATRARANPPRPAPAGDEPAASRRGTGTESQERARPTAVENREATAEWTVQVGVFKSLHQAEGVRRQLSGGGFDARVTPVIADDGQARYRVRVGAFRTRDEAVRAAERVRSDRSLPTFVTAK